jgi:hypothetical protein
MPSLFSHRCRFEKHLSNSIQVAAQWLEANEALSWSVRSARRVVLDYGVPQENPMSEGDAL